MYSCVWLCRVMYGYVKLCNAMKAYGMYGYVWVCRVMSCCVWLCRLCMAMYGM